MAKQWFYEIMGEELGPISSAELRRKAESGEVTPDTSIRMGAQGAWQIAAEVPP